MNVCYDKKIAVLYFCIEGEPRLQTRSGRRAGRDWTAQTTVDQRHVIVLLVVFCFGFFFCQMNHCHVVNTEAPPPPLSVLDTVCSSVCWCLYEFVIHKEIVKVHVPL